MSNRTEAEKQAQREYQKGWREKNREKLRASQRRWEKSNPEHPSRALEGMRQWRATRSDEWRELQRTMARQRYAESPESRERSLLRARKHRQANPDKRRAKEARERARKKNAVGTYTETDVQKQYAAQRGRCFYCHENLSATRAEYHADHVIPLARGGRNSPDNIVVACPECNCRKADQTPEEFAGLLL